MKKGDIVLIVFPFTDLSGNKLRPALIQAVTTDDLTVLFITTQLKWLEATDIMLLPDNNNGIKKQSLVRTSKIATLDKTLVKGRLGSATKMLQNEVDVQLKDYLKLP